MNKNLLLYAGILLMVFSSCHQMNFDTEVSESAPMSETIKSRYRYDVGIETAKYLASVLSEDSIRTLTPIISDYLDTVAYIVQYEDGWAILSGDKRAKPVLGCADIGNFLDQQKNPGSKVWFKDIINQLEVLKQINPKIDDKLLRANSDYQFWMKMEKASRSRSLSATRMEYGYSPEPEGLKFLCKRLVSVTEVSSNNEHYGHYLKTKWGQKYPWNIQLPSVPVTDTYSVTPPTGCVAVAFAQILYFTHYKWNVPSGLYHTATAPFCNPCLPDWHEHFRREDYVENSPRWDMMPKDKRGFNHSYVSDLMIDVGNHLKMEYWLEFSGTFPSQAAMQAYGLTYDEKLYDEETVKQNIRAGMPVMVNAYNSYYVVNNDTVPEDGHQWVIDGMHISEKVLRYDYVWELVYVPLPEGYHNLDEYGYPYEGDPIYDNLWLTYEEFLPEHVAVERNIRITQTEVKIEEYKDNYLLMNWGWDGKDDDNKYALSVSSVWNAGNWGYHYKKKIQYNIRKYLE